MKKLYLGSASELRRRVKGIENTEVLKLIHDMSSVGENPKSDIMIVTEDATPVPVPYVPADVESPIKTTSYTGDNAQDYDSGLNNLTRVMFCNTEPSDIDVLWAKPIEGNRYQFHAYYNDMWNSIGGGDGSVVINISDVSGNVSTFANDAGYITNADVQRLIKTKQDTISDLEEIRSNASVGADAASSIDEIWATIASITPGSSEGGESGLLELSTEDGTANKLLLNAALAQGDVKLKKGHYPLDPYVIVDNVVLDLNGACLQSTQERDTKPLIFLRGDKPVLRNGELCGNYNTPYSGIAAKGETPGPGEVEFFENESLIGIGHYNYNNILIENMDLHNVWGYAIKDWGPNVESSTIYNSVRDNEFLGRKYALVLNPGSVNWYKGIVEVLDNNGNISDNFELTPIMNRIKNSGSNLFTFSYNARTFVSQEIGVPEGCRYVCITSGSGYTNRYAVDIDSTFYFYDSNGDEVKITGSNGGRVSTSVTEMPRVMVEIPEGAAYVIARVNFKRSQGTAILEPQVVFCKYRCNSVTVKDCCMHNNSSLGMCGTNNGILRITNCRSYEQGRPYSSACSPDGKNQTTGFLDIEDNPTPILIMDGCVSEREHALVMTNAYKNTITNCHGLVSVHGGWTANIANCTGNIRVSDTTLTTLICVSNCVNYSTPQGSVNWVGSNNVFRGAAAPSPSKERNFLIERFDANGSTISLKGLIVGRFYMPVCRGGNLGIHNINTSKGSQFIYNFNLWTNADSNSMGTTEELVIGDCYGITSTCPFLPNGHTIYDSTFNLSHSYGQTNKTNNSWTGEYNNCVFNLNGGSMFYNNTGSSAVNQFNLKDSGGVLIFRNCIINNSNTVPLFKTLPANASNMNYTVKFINCTISDENNLFAVSTSGINVEIITEDTDYDARIKALLARIEALEGN